MRRGLKSILMIALIMVMTAAVLSGCGPKKPTPEDAQAYVKAVLDLMCTGDYDHSVNLGDIEEGKESETRDGLIDDMMNGLSAQANLNDDVTAAFRDFMIDAFGKAKYTVGEAVETEDGGYDVTVSIEPLQIFTDINDELEAVLQEKVASEPEKILAMSADEQTNYVMEILIDLINKKIADPKYDAAEEVVVHYGLMEGYDDVYGCEESDGEKLGAKLFSSSGL